MGRHPTAAAPEPAGRVQAVGFDGDPGRLDVAPDAPAYGTKLRWIAPKLVAAANAKVSGANLPVIKRIDSATVRAELGRFVEQARTRRAGPGQLALIDASAALAIG
ncbi:hypothetical protein ACFRFL_00035 [Streptomyces sp. NPDC056708]|uniref:hypothetical protein n=1 Tax=unclassified Streptomyces TaxID=2593676 RepID=UPI0036A7CEF9